MGETTYIEHKLGMYLVFFSTMRSVYNIISIKTVFYFSTQTIKARLSAQNITNKKVLQPTKEPSVYYKSFEHFTNRVNLLKLPAEWQISIQEEYVSKQWLAISNHNNNEQFLLRPGNKSEAPDTHL